MGDESSLEPATTADGPARRRSRRSFVVAAVLGVGLALLLGILLRDWIPGSWRGEEARDNGFSPGALVDYVPEDSEAVLVVNLHTLLESPAGQQLRPSLTQLVRQGESRIRWLNLVGVNPLDDLDYLQVSFAPSSGGQPLWLARGRLDRARFQMGPDKLQPKTADHFRVLEYTDRPAKRTTLIATADDALIASESPARVVAALSQARDPRPATIGDATLRELLHKVDRRQSVWFAASFQKLGAVARIDNFLLEMILRPLFTHAESVYGGIDCAEDVRAELHFHTATEDSAVMLEADLQHICNVAQEVSQGAALLLRQKELVPLLRLLGTGQTRRQGHTVSLRCQLPAAQVNE